MMTRFTIFFLTSLFSIIANGQQTNDGDIRKQVLEKGTVDSLFIFDKWTKSGQTETHLKYLGQINTEDGRIIKIMNSCLIWGHSERGTSRILIFNEKNQYLGNYLMNADYELPEKLIEGKLIFSNEKCEDSELKIKGKISFLKGIPEQFFIECFGSFYKFEP
ncbi:MAG: hypothetical protein U0W24_04655 [Bacteroidales bacterium]